MLDTYLRGHMADEVVVNLWRQMVVTMNAFASRCIDKGDYNTGYQILSRASTLAENEEIFSRNSSLHLKAFIHDTYAYYYYRKKKAQAALSFSQKAMKVHHRMQDWAHVSKCHLHSGAILGRLGRHDEAVRCYAQVLALVEDGSLNVGGTQPQKLCMVAVCYHNIAVEQLTLNLISEVI